MYLCFPTLSMILLKIPLGKWFFKFWSRMTIFAKRKFGRDFETEHFLNVLFADLWLFQGYTDIVHVLYQNFCGKVLKNRWVQVDPPPLVPKREYKVAQALKC